MISLLLAAVSCMPLPTCTEPVTITPCATPTPVVSWDQVGDADLAGYSIYFRDTGAVGWSWLGDIPCVWYDTDDPPDGIAETRFCDGPDLGLALQRWCDACAPYQSYEVSVKAYDTAYNLSLDYSNSVEVCFSPICVAPGPCS